MSLLIVLPECCLYVAECLLICSVIRFVGIYGVLHVLWYEVFKHHHHEFLIVETFVSLFCCFGHSVEPDVEFGLQL